MAKKAVTATLLRRIIALVIDLFIINFIVSIPLRSVYDSLIPQVSFDEMVSLVQSSNHLMGISILILLIWAIVAFLYMALFESNLNQTPGMMFLRLRVEGDMDFSKALLRSAFIFPFFPFYFLWFIEPAFLFFKGQRLTEIVTKTRVVQEVNFSGGFLR